MKRKTILSMLLAGAVAFGAQAEDFEGNIYIQNATIVPGQTTTVSVQLENNIPIRGFQFEMYLPEGVTVVDYEMNSERWPEGGSEFGSLQQKPGASYYTFAMSVYEELTFTGNTGEIASITIKADNSVAEGEYTVGLKEIYLFDIADPAPIFEKEEDSFTLTVVESIPFEGDVYLEDATIFPGQTTTVSVQLENNIPIRGFQFEMYLPEGVTVVDYEMNSERWPEGGSEFGSLQQRPGASYYTFAMSVYEELTFTGNTGEIASITIKADNSVAAGEYTVGLKEIYLFDSADPAPVFEKEEDSFTLTVNSFSEGYVMDFLPFAVNEGEGEVSLLLDNLTAITNISFDLEMPEVLVDLNEDSYYYFIETLLGRNFTVSDEPDAGGIVHVSIDRRSKYKIAAGENTGIVTFGIFDEEGVLSEGVYSIKINNIQMTDENGEAYLAAPYTTEIFVGDDPKATVTDGVVAFHGNYGETEGFELLKASLPEGATIDLTEVSDMAEDPSELRTDNVIVTAEAISYGRAMTNEWGSLCLPFAVESNENIQLYELKSASSSAMTFDPVASVEANTPVIFKTLSNGFSVKAANDKFNTGFAAASSEPSIEAITNWVLNGSYSEKTIDVSGMQAYGLMNNEFHRFTKSLTAGAFRAWLQNNGAPMNATIRIEESTDGISIIEQEDGSVKLIFDMQGRQLKDNVRQQMIIENGHKVVRSK